MKPIEFELRKRISLSAKEICEKIADLDNWSDFDGYGFLPGIEKAEYEKKTKEMLGSRIRVKNADGSQHVEEILEWDDGKKIVMKLHEFTKPLNNLATHFIEEWNFEELEIGETIAKRKFELYAKNLVTYPFMYLISVFFRKAVAKHLDEMEEEAKKK